MRHIDQVSSRRTRSALAIVIALIAVVALGAAFTVAPSAAAPKTTTGPTPLTLTFAGQVVTSSGLEPFVGPWPPIEGGAARIYVVPEGSRLVIQSVYADILERHPPDVTGRSGVSASVNTWYNLGEECMYPGYQRTYGIPLTDPIVETSELVEITRTGYLGGPIYVEGGRTVNGNAFGPNGDDELFVAIVVHGYLEPTTTNPPAPVCGAP